MLHAEVLVVLSYAQGALALVPGLLLRSTKAGPDTEWELRNWGLLQARRETVVRRGPRKSPWCLSSPSKSAALWLSAPSLLLCFSLALIIT